MAKKHDVSKEKRDKSGKWTAGGAGSSTATTAIAKVKKPKNSPKKSSDYSLPIAGAVGVLGGVAASTIYRASKLLTEEAKKDPVILEKARSIFTPEESPRQAFIRALTRGLINSDKLQAVRTPGKVITDVGKDFLESGGSPGGTLARSAARAAKDVLWEMPIERQKRVGRERAAEIGKALKDIPGTIGKISNKLVDYTVNAAKSIFGVATFLSGMSLPQIAIAAAIGYGVYKIYKHYKNKSAMRKRAEEAAKRYTEFKEWKAYQRGEPIDEESENNEELEYA